MSADAGAVWLPPPSPPWALPEGSVHVWAVALDAAPTSACFELLATAERDRAARFHFERDRQAFAVTRATLRRLVSGYMGGDPAAWRFELNPYGKPGLSGSRLAFNVSHSGARALIAFSRRPVGIDLERQRPIADMAALATRTFSPAEARALARRPACERERAFFSLWTAKEALVKGLGFGLSLDLAHFDLDVGAHGPIQIQATRFDPAVASAWRIERLEPGPGYVAALAIEGPLERLHTWQASPSGRP